MKISFYHIVILLILAIGIMYFHVENIWKLLFTRGNIRGVYWLFVFADKTAFPLACLFLGASILLALFILSMRFLNIEWFPLEKAGKTAIALFVSSVFLIATFISVAALYTIPLDTKQAKGRVYYLAAYPGLDINYGLYECDPFGILCNQIYFSGDYTSEINGHLIYYPESSRIAIAVGGEGIIYVHELTQK